MAMADTLLIFFFLIKIRYMATVVAEASPRVISATELPEAVSLPPPPPPLDVVLARCLFRGTILYRTRRLSAALFYGAACW